MNQQADTGDIFSFAMQMELDGKAFYEKGADSTDNESLKKIFQQLAEEEHRHYHVFKKLQAGETSDPSADLAPKGSTVNSVKNIFREMTESGRDTLAGDSSRTLWQEAREVEIKSEKLYRDAADRQADSHRRKMLNLIADEEKNHIYLIDNMLAFLTDPSGFASSQDYKNFMSWEGR